MDFAHSSLLSCNLIPYLHLWRRSCHARVFSVQSDLAPSPSHRFNTELAEKLKTLNDFKGNISSLNLSSLDWICQALDVVISTQAYVKQTLHESRCTPSAASNASLAKVVKQWAEDSVKLLDACHLLKETLVGARACVKASLITLKCLQGLNLAKHGGTIRAKHALIYAEHQLQEGILPGDLFSTNMNIAKSKATDCTKRFRACGSMLRRMGDKFPIPAAHCQSLNSGEVGDAATTIGMYGAEICTLFVLRLLLRMLAPPRVLTYSSSSSIASLQLSGQLEWECILQDLQAQFNAEIAQISTQRKMQRVRNVVFEFCELRDCLNQISESLQGASTSEQGREALQGLIYSTSALANHVHGTVTRLQEQLDCVCCFLVDIRMLLLDQAVGA